MKNYFSILSIFICCLTYAQVIIGDKIGTATNKNAVLLEFAAGQNKGIVLPYVRQMPTTPSLGTLLLDASDAENATVKYYNGSWIDLSSGNTANVSAQMANQPGNTVVENPAAKTIIGSETSTASGVLVLESTEKVMVLPHVDSVADVKSPAPGMMVYVNKTGAKKLAIFNGAKWTFWGPN